MPSESVNRVNAMIRAAESQYRITSDGHGRVQFVPITTEPEGDDQTEAPRRVVDGGADGGRGREDPPRPTPMNELIRELAFGAFARKMR